MSLLMEALKKAEESKRLAGENQADKTATPAAELTLAPLTSSGNKPSSRGSPLPELSLHTDALDADLAASAASPRTQSARLKQQPTATAAIAHETSGREAARNVFSAKQATEKPRSSLPLILTVGGAAMLILGAYFWWQLQALSNNALVPLAVSERPAPLASPVAPVAPAPSPAPPNSASPATQTPAPPAPPAASDTPPGQTESAVAASVFAEERPAPRPKKTASTTTAAPAPDAERLVRITRNPPKPNQTIETAYDALLAGQFDLAQRNYELVLRRDAKNTDALLGLATIAFSRGDTERANRFYLAALESNPTNATAQAGLVTTGGQSDPDLAESRLKTALSNQPDSSALHFALGNLYARQARWSEAQQAYFNAYSIEPDNADFIFNQAVSLDHLHQSKLAAQYYRMALETADRDGIAHPVAFDRQQVHTRLQQLQP